MDTIIQKDRDEMEIIAKSNNDFPVLMINQNRYLKGEFPNGDLYSSIGKLPKSSITYLMFLLAARTNILSLPSPFNFR